MKWYEDDNKVNAILKTEYVENLQHDYNKVQEYYMDIENLLNKMTMKMHDIQTTLGRITVMNSTTKIYELKKEYEKLLMEISEAIKEVSENV